MVTLDDLVPKDHPPSQILQKLTISCGRSLYAWYFCDKWPKVGKIVPAAHLRQGSASIDAMNQCDDSPVRSPRSSMFEQVHMPGCPAPHATMIFT
ncbi:hypothetical protein WL30_27170 [Burkholderia ubonensis]|uniref:hypothetical protein n=1 Tax=Burkholderia ubonensis TaxID=101571 RepID=UPI000753EF38|nr:hypothetical protein [Burkholderia ubonensis]KVO10963.1 hypothetical protein WJ74_17455 [Burkholderia ubonensis]KVU91345.1 hypothetical protein WK75_17060 [Burkholderia ubonensis]KWA81272.1 hypothetical protein WL30_27170 [Burkholderia ubonensis]KWB13300.1 hypothetical protein WL31_19115 [Burkholderia ubonensis]KWC08087.1 hypothetical protein WL44_20195 [Burkholderia ubonensis]